MKKRTFKRSAIAMLMAMVLLVSPMQVFAEEVPTEARYDLEKGGTQTFVVQDENGEIGTVTVEELEGSSRIANGNYQVSYENPLVWTAGFNVSISNNQIYNAYSPFHYCIMGEIKYPALTRPSVTKATYAFIYRSISNINISTGLDATISGSELIITKR